ncbi:FAD-linked oxidoreductase-like protein [Zychaea mexicana]|uniref:FAD-linked oxidoreductase-like protein n=1 Tax=Zychaea mexicana TaxID=64656 RepID=UPI0022FF3155|nr:FAD-linked oxidoreductase-like protein [Zychaea mexicana]KAI9479603.1 FAD-linked oxidoreductase-like protein [Zychaea mexicana]
MHRSVAYLPRTTLRHCLRQIPSPPQQPPPQPQQLLPIPSFTSPSANCYARFQRAYYSSTGSRASSSSSSTHFSSPASSPRAFKTGIAAATALVSGSLFYHYCWNKDRPLINVCYAEAENKLSILPISAFSSSTPSGTIAELADDESRVAMRAKSSEELMLALLVYSLCSVPIFVDMAPHIINAAEALHLQGPLFWLIKRTVFQHFCGGETPDECAHCMERLAQSGINVILDLSIEADLHLDAKTPPKTQGYYPHLEHRADVTVEMIKECLRTAAKGRELCGDTFGAFAAVKITAFAPPELLLRVNQVLVQMEQAFDAWQRGDGTIDSEGLEQIVHYVLPPAGSPAQEKKRQEILSRIDALDRIEATKLFDLQGKDRNVWWSTEELHRENTPLTFEELQAYDRMVNRLDQVCRMAHDKHVGIMVDAEQSYFQEAIDHVAMNLQQKYNRRDDREHTPTVYNTYQMYTKAAQKKLERDVERAKRENFGFAAKLVRGAYMVMERKRAAQLGYPSPIHDTLEDTHDSYNNGVRFLLDKLRERQEATGEPLASTTAPVVFMIASHNRESVKLTVKEMERHNVLPRSGVVHFGQLYGMQDQLSYTLGKNGYSTYKYLPYGKIDEVMPYLLRRAQENSTMLGGVNKELTLIWQELKDRWSGNRGVVVRPKAIAGSQTTAAPDTGAATTEVDVATESTANTV